MVFSPIFPKLGHLVGNRFEETELYRVLLNSVASVFYMCSSPEEVVPKRESYDGTLELMQMRTLSLAGWVQLL